MADSADKKPDPDEVDAFTPEELLQHWLSADYERRQYRRWQIDESALVKYAGTRQDCLVRDISPGGAQVEFDGAENLSVNVKLVLELDGAAPLVAEVRSNPEGRLGLSFLHDAEGEEALARWLMQMENSRRQHRRREVACPATLHVEGAARPCRTRNVSLGGVNIEGGEIADLALGAEVALEFDGVGPVPAHVRHRLEDTVGLKFDHTPETLRALIAWLK